ncbi:MAG: hypothetical protein ACRD2H_05705, partial [Terriglobales bacterium]
EQEPPAPELFHKAATEASRPARGAEQQTAAPQPQRQKKPPADKYAIGELVVLNEWGHIHQLNFRNTGDSKQDRAAHLKHIDRASLLSVTAAASVVKQLRQDRREEWRQQRQQQRDEAATAPQEKHWPTKPPEPQGKSTRLFEQAATEAARDQRPENLYGMAARVWDLWTKIDREKHEAALNGNVPFSVRTDGKAFAAALDERGIGFAAVTKDEAEQSHREADRSHTANEFAKAIGRTGNHAPRLKEGEIVIVTAPLPEYRREGEITPPRRVHQLDQSLAAKFVEATGGRSELKGIEATRQILTARAQDRTAKWEAIRLENATAKRGIRRDRPGIIPAAPNLAKAVNRTVAGVLGGLSKLADGFSLGGLTPKEKHEAAKRDHRNEREADKTESYAEYIAALAETRRRDQQQEAEHQQQRDRDRERERDR